MLDLRAGLKTTFFWLKMNRDMLQSGKKIERKVDISKLARHGSDIMERLGRDGVVAVPRYWSEEDCRVARSEIDRLIETFSANVQRYSGGSDKRMFGVEAVSEPLADFHSDPTLRGVGELLGGYELYNFSTLGARIDASRENNGSGDGWHRDAHGFQFKSILYLSDVTEENGPFEYIPGSHKTWRAAFDTALGGLPPAPNTRYEPALIDRLVGRFGVTRREFVGAAGTLLLVNTSGLHRGRPLVSGTRYALTNYYYNSFQLGEARLKQFEPLMPGMAARVRADLLAS